MFGIAVVEACAVHLVDCLFQYSEVSAQGFQAFVRRLKFLLEPLVLQRHLILPQIVRREVLMQQLVRLRLRVVELELVFDGVEMFEEELMYIECLLPEFESFEAFLLLFRLIASGAQVGLRLCRHPDALGQSVLHVDKVGSELLDFAVQDESGDDGLLLPRLLCLRIAQAFLCDAAPFLQVGSPMPRLFDTLRKGILLRLYGSDDVAAFADALVERPKLLHIVREFEPHLLAPQGEILFVHLPMVVRGILQKFRSLLVLFVPFEHSVDGLQPLPAVGDADRHMVFAFARRLEVSIAELRRCSCILARHEVCGDRAVLLHDFSGLL